MPKRVLDKSGNKISPENKKMPNSDDKALATLTKAQFEAMTRKLAKAQDDARHEGFAAGKSTAEAKAASASGSGSHAGSTGSGSGAGRMLGARMKATGAVNYTSKILAYPEKERWDVVGGGVERHAQGREGRADDSGRCGTTAQQILHHRERA